MFALEAITGVLGLVFPPVFDFVKKKFLKPSEDTPEATMSALATTKPEILPDFIKGQVEWLKAKIEWFNRDVVGEPSKWVINLRASIRPIVTCVCLALITSDAAADSFTLTEPTRAALIFIISSWFGDRLIK